MTLGGQDNELGLRPSSPTTGDDFGIPCSCACHVLISDELGLMPSSLETNMGGQSVIITSVVKDHRFKEPNLCTIAESTAEPPMMSSSSETDGSLGVL
ncbi:hypothetical protein TIFTF001_051790 [Ficus carica]|uniref:Uncharacterized protein n=1 Tax=Ficus carica TaxID=3494 RepID=A0AA88EKC8_FICCA|nr:hypothetical protein TIFTF001_051790 [Ficus carica]